ncbi:hypothetical protein FQN54_000245 [Arachnomyces sp. PD_36]|nr:hypothetical protein FQN54_000245 [Arachnomyces sp. PD_36]
MPLTSNTNSNNFSYNRPTLYSDSSHEQQQPLSSLSSASQNDPSPSAPPPLTGFFSPIPLTPSGTHSNPLPQPHLPTAPHPPQLNPRSCTTCRRRKVRCNKRNPCSNCTKAGIECIFPAPGRAPRRSKKPADSELLTRLRRLEGVVQALGAHVDDDGVVVGGGRGDASPVSAARSAPTAGASPLIATDSGSADRDEEMVQAKGAMCSDFADADPRKIRARKIDQEFGRLVVDDGRSRYVSNRFWASLGDEIEEMRYILDPSSSEDEEDSPSAENSKKSHSSCADGHDGFLFSFRSVTNSLRNFHPTPTHAFILWDTYKENVAPIVPIFHFPTAEKIYLEALSNLDTISRTTETMIFSIYYAALTSMTPEQCRTLMGEEPESILNRYRFAMEQSLARAEILNSQSLMVLQAMVLFLICVRRHDDTRYTWTMSAVVQRIAQGMGIHRDGTTFSLKPFETEMRRRLWWHICILDIRTAEDHGTDPSIHEAFYDTRLPLNINDDDINPESKELPEDRIGCTEMTFFLIRCEVTIAVRRLHYLPPNEQAPSNLESISVDEREGLVESLNSRLEERYLKYCDMSVPIFWVSATVARLIVAKSWLVVHHPMSRKDHGAGLPPDTRDRLFLTSVEVLEFSHLLQTNENTSKWGWLFHTYVQWHAVAFILSELCFRTKCPAVDRAWRAVEAVYDGWESRAKERRRGMLWRPLKKLMIRARKFQAEQEKLPQLPYPINPDATSGYATGPVPSGTGLRNPNPQVPETQKPQAPPELDIDLSKGMTDILDELVPEGFNQQPPQPENTMPVTQFPSDMNIDSGLPPTGNQYVTQWLDSSNPAPNLGTMPSMVPDQTSQSEWDQAIRDFQMDIQQANGPPPLGGVSDWFG